MESSRQILQETELSDHIDNLLIGVYGIAGFFCLVLYRREVLKFFRSWRYLLLSAFSSILTVVLDFAGGAHYIWKQLFSQPRAIQLVTEVIELLEEVFKIFAEVFFIGAFASVLVFSRGLRRNSIPDSPEVGRAVSP